MGMIGPSVSLNLPIVNSSLKATIFLYQVKMCFWFLLSKDGDKQCTAPDYPFRSYGTIGAKGVDGNPLICGGSGDGPDEIEERCFSLVNGEWKNELNMMEQRAYASVVALGDQVSF